MAVDVLVAGDSVAWQFAGTRDPYGLADQYAVYGIAPSQYGLAAKGFQVVNGAYPGTGPAREDTMYPVTWADTHWLGTLIDNYAPRKVVISFGGNTDVWNNTHDGTEPRNTARWQLLSIAGMQDIIGDARSRLHDTDIVVVDGWVVGPSAEGTDWDGSLNWFGQYMIQSVESLYPNLRWVHMSDVAGTDTQYRWPDTIHLNDDGSSLTADRVKAQLAFDSSGSGGSAPVSATLPVVLPPEPAIPVFTVTDSFRKAVTESHEVVNKVKVRRIDIPDVVAELPIYDGSITVSSADATHRSADLSFVVDSTGAELVTADAEDLLSPFWCELEVWSGVRHPNGEEELLPCGVYRVTDYERDGKTHKVTCYDRSIRFRQKLGAPYTIAPGVPIEVAYGDLLRSKAPTLPIHLPTTGFVTPSLVLAESSTAWGEASKIFASSGYVLQVNRTGVTVAEPLKLDATLPADWTFEENERDVAWKVTRKQKVAANHIIVTSTNTGAQGVRGEAMDTDPTSPTYVHGPYGDVVDEQSDERVTTTEQANRSAAVRLVRSLAGAEENGTSALPNPAMNLDDTVRLNRQTVEFDAFVLVDEYTLPLNGKEMTIKFRRSLSTDAARQASLTTVSRLPTTIAARVYFPTVFNFATPESVFVRAGVAQP